MKLSKYVKTIFTNSSTILFNTINANIVEFPHQKNNDIDLLLQELSDDELIYLRENLFFISDQDALKFFFASPVSHSLNITVSLTEFCNLKCQYCYENNLIHKSVIFQKTIDKIIQYICEVLSKNKSISAVNIDLIGGEPLLEIKQIQYLIHKLKTVNGVPFYFTLETNGTLFSEEVQEILSETSILVSVPLTIEADHNIMRPFKDGRSSSYTTIVENLVRAKAFFEDQKHQLVFRYNAHSANIHYFDEFFETVNALLPYSFEIELARIINYPYNIPCQILSYAEYSEWFLKTYFKYTKDAYSKEHFLLPRKCFVSCVAYNPDDIKFHPDGSLALCNAWTPQNRCGNIDRLLSGKTKKEIFSTNRLFEPEIDHACYECPDIFLCGGKKICNLDNPCEFVDFNINDYIIKYVSGRNQTQN